MEKSRGQKRKTGVVLRYNETSMYLGDIFKKAKEEKWAVPQFNFSTLSQLRGIIQAGSVLGSPIILGTSEGEAGFLGMKKVAKLVEAIRKEGKKDVFSHLDHGKSFEVVKDAVEAGYDSVHIDGSELPFDENLKITEKVVKYAKEKDVWVEGELGVIGGGKKKSVFTDPSFVSEFVKKTGVSSLAVSIGNVHGVLDKMPRLRFDILRKIKKEADIFLVFHGSSGFSLKEIKKVVEEGFQKVNVNTALRKEWRRVLEKSLRNKKSIKPYEILPSVSDATEKKCKEYIKILNASGKSETQ